jgi:hypothetical protein
MRKSEGWRWRAAQPSDGLAMSREQILKCDSTHVAHESGGQHIERQLLNEGIQIQ